tara:strand:+ start:441 stop:1460 length:1020 start_codon:yes stop_codon:yes gene_type:complete
MIGSPQKPDSPMKKILSISLSPTIDVSCDAQHVQPTRKIRTFNQSYQPGGCGVNVARVIAELGSSPDLLYLTGGATGALLTDSLDKTTIRLHALASSGSTRISYTVHETQSGLEYRFVPEGTRMSDGEFQKVLEEIEKLDFDYIVLSGSLPKDAPPDSYARITQKAMARGALVILDSSGKALEKALKEPGVFLVKPSLGELEQLVGRSLDRDAAGHEAMALIKTGSAKIIVVSLGADGALLVQSSGIIYAPAPTVLVRSAVGAGDSFVGAMTLALSMGSTVEEAFHFGAAAGSAAVMTPGTQLCRREDVLQLYQQSANNRQMAENNDLLRKLANPTFPA